MDKGRAAKVGDWIAWGTEDKFSLPRTSIVSLPGHSGALWIQGGWFRRREGIHGEEQWSGGTFIKTRSASWGPCHCLRRWEQRLRKGSSPHGLVRHLAALQTWTLFWDTVGLEYICGGGRGKEKGQGPWVLRSEDKLKRRERGREVAARISFEAPGSVPHVFCAYPRLWQLSREGIVTLLSR